jgi:hypothetical protein
MDTLVRHFEKLHGGARQVHVRRFANMLVGGSDEAFVRATIAQFNAVDIESMLTRLLNEATRLDTLGDLVDLSFRIYRSDKYFSTVQDQLASDTPARQLLTQLNTAYARVMDSLDETLQNRMHEFWETEMDDFLDEAYQAKKYDLVHTYNTTLRDLVNLYHTLRFVTGSDRTQLVFQSIDETQVHAKMYLGMVNAMHQRPRSGSDSESESVRDLFDSDSDSDSSIIAPTRTDNSQNPRARSRSRSRDRENGGGGENPAPI